MSRQILGFGLPPALAIELKLKGTQRALSLRKLVSEIWPHYKQPQQK